MINPVQNIIVLSERFASASNRSISTISRLSTGSGQTIARLKAGHDITFGRAQRATQWFSNNWPTKTLWPRHIERPAPQIDIPRRIATTRRRKCA